MKKFGHKRGPGHDSRFRESNIHTSSQINRLLRDYKKESPYHSKILSIVPSGNKSSGVSWNTLDQLTEKLSDGAGRPDKNKLLESLGLLNDLQLVQMVKYEGQDVYSRTIIGDAVAEKGLDALKSFGGLYTNKVRL